MRVSVGDWELLASFRDGVGTTRMFAEECGF
jgi:hypothetical protein